MSEVKVRIGDKNFWSKYKKVAEQGYDYIEFESPTGCKFQDAYSFKTGKWLEMRPIELRKHYEKYPDDRVRLSLIAFHRNWYSVAKLGNCKITYEVVR